MNPTDYLSFAKRVEDWKGQSLRFFAKRDVNEQSYDTRPSMVKRV